MQSPINDSFSRMDALSLQGKPFFFLIDFLVENIEIYTYEELSKSSLLIDFKGFKYDFNQDKLDGNYWFNSFPEDVESYSKGFHKIKEHLYRGDSYLVNYTRKTPIETNLSLEQIFDLSEAKYKVCKPGEFVFFSPETFVEVKDHRIYTHPMKGTIDASVENAAEILKNDVKEKAEHYTVVDLLRNDLSMVADRVTVEEFQRVDFIKTRQKDLFAMSSEISGEVKPSFQNKVGSIMKALLPAGSILGAPKEKTMQIILKSEGYNRGWYTGVCGWFDGKNLDSCVMIRFIETENNQLFFKSGGGITHMSRLEDEYQEMKNKIYVPIY